MFYNNLISSVAIALTALAGVKAEQHLVHFDNRCGFGTPTLIGEGGVTFSTGGDVLFESEIRGLIAYLQTGGCGFNGEGCLTVEASLVNGQSSADLTLIPPHSFSVTSGPSGKRPLAHRPQMAANGLPTPRHAQGRSGLRSRSGAAQALFSTAQMQLL